MDRSLPALLGCALIVGLSVAGAACSSAPASPPAQPAGTVGPGASSTADPAPAPTTSSAGTTTATGTTTPPPPPPPSNWVAPVVATTSAACGVARGQAIHEDFTTPGGRTFHVWGPAGYDANKTYPVVIAFHGWYADGAAHEGWFKMEDYVDNAAFVVYPDAVNGLWDLDGDSDLVFFDEMVKQLGETYCINPSRVFGFGFSFGGKFMNHLGCRRAGYVKAISIGDGSDGGNGLNCGRLPVLVTNRTMDNNELVAWGRATSEHWVTLNGCSAATTISDGPASAAPVPGTADKPQNCVTHASCAAPGTVTFCEDSWFDPSWQADWNHTVRTEYRAYTWQWFNALP